MNDEVSSASVLAGLSESEAQARLKREGYNELPRAGRRTPFRIVLEVMREPMLALLVGGGAVYLALGDLQEALILLAFAMVSIVITVVQETRTERVLEALRDLTSPRALVIRDGERPVGGYREIVMITGDYPTTARAIAKQAGLEARQIMTGEELDPLRGCGAGRAGLSSENEVAITPADLIIGTADQDLRRCCHGMLSAFVG